MKQFIMLCIKVWAVSGVMLCVAMFPTGAQASLTLAPLFGDGMVLQRGVPLPVWGRATPASLISVRFAEQTYAVRADKQGQWKIVLPAMVAKGQGQNLEVWGDGDSRILHDILIGEVWLCAGQSNMEFPLQSEATGKSAIAEANNSQLRLNLWRYGTQFIYNAPFTPQQVETLKVDNFYWNSWQIDSPQSASEFSAIGYFYGRELQQKLGVPVGVISLAAGGSPTEAWISRDALNATPQLSAIVKGNWLDNTALDDWCRERGHQNLDKPLEVGAVPTDDLGPNHAFKPAMLWDAGMAKILPFPVRGVLWYQGESNSLEPRRVEQHHQLFPLLVKDWRAHWGNPRLPFYYCQLSGISTNTYKSAFWPEFRDQQRCFLQIIPNTGMAVTSDLGAENNVHPTNKREVALRLARIALAKSYGQKLEYSGPTPQTLRRKGATLIISFAHAQGLKASAGESVRGFEIAASDGIFQPADARIEGHKVVLSCSAVTSPSRVRYAWTPFVNASANLINSSELPASTFQLSLP